MQKDSTVEREQIQEKWNEMHKIDSSNVVRILEILDEVGRYPGKSLVGHKASKTVFLVLQHAPDFIQSEYLEMILQAGKENELDANSVALYHDRYLMHQNLPQIYGSQVRFTTKTDSITGEKIEIGYVWPIADTTNIDSLRMYNGLGPLEEYLNQFGLSRWDDQMRLPDVKIE